MVVLVIVIRAHKKGLSELWKNLNIVETKIDIGSLLDIASKAAIKAGKAILRIYGSSSERENLTEDFPVTRADKLSHKILVDELSKTGLTILSEEGAPVDYDERKHWQHFWLIDPLDGTKEFLKKNGEFTISIGLVNHHIPIGGVVYVPCQELLYYGSAATGVFKISKGKKNPLTPLLLKRSINDLFQKEGAKIVVSRSHLTKETESFIRRFKNPTMIAKGSSLKFLLLLEDAADLYPRIATTMEWDTAAAHALLHASGRGIYQLDFKSELEYNKPDLRNPSFIAF